jgi:hypothetical protein
MGALEPQPKRYEMLRITRAALGLTFSLGLLAGGAGTAMAQSQDAATLTDSDQQITIELEAAGTAGVAGEAVLRSAGDQTRVSIEVTGARPDAELAGSLISGECADDGEVLATIGAIEVDEDGNGRLTADLSIDLATLT